MKEVNVVRALLRCNGKYLLLKPVEIDIPYNEGKWECPGGYIEAGEEPKDAILREVREETGLNCKILKKVSYLEAVAGNYHSKCHVFLAEAPLEDINVCCEHNEYKWVKAKDVKNENLVLFSSLLLEYFNNEDLYL